MKFLVVILCVSVGLIAALPARNPNDDAEIVIVPKGQQGVTERDQDSDSDEGYFRFPFSQPTLRFNIGFSDSFSDIFRRFHSHLNPWGSSESKESGDDSVAFPAFGLPIPQGGNTTHTVKVVDGHKVEINDTVYENKGDFGSSVFKVRIINVRPVEPEEKVEEGTRASGKTEAPPKQPESTRESTEDIDDSVNDINANINNPESTTTSIAHTSVDSTSPSDDSVEEATNEPDVTTTETNFEEFGESVESINSNEMKKLEYSKVYPLHEEFSSMDSEAVTDDKWNSKELESFDISNEIFGNDDLYAPESVPIDLSNDIAVNDMLADQGIVDPDAEVFDVNEFKRTAPQFEKLDNFDPIK